MKFRLHGQKLEHDPNLSEEHLRWAATGFEWIQIGTPDAILGSAEASYNPPVSEPRVEGSDATAPSDQPLDGLWLFFGGQGRLWGSPYAPSGGTEICRQFAGIAERYYGADPRYVLPIALEFGAHYGPLGHGAILVKEVLGRMRSTMPVFYAEPTILWLNEAITMRAALRLQTALEEVRRRPASARGTLIGMSVDGRRIPNLQRLMGAGLGLTELARQKGVPVSELSLLLGQRRLPLEKWLGSPAVDMDYAFLATSHENLAHGRNAAPGLDGLAAEIKAELLGLIDRKLCQHTATRCLGLDSPKVACVPKNLLGHMYLSLARSICHPKLDRCVVCLGAIEVRRRRAEGNCCSERCAKARQRARKKLLA